MATMVTENVTLRDRKLGGVSKLKRSKAIAFSPSKKRVVFDDKSNLARQTRNKERNQGSKSAENLSKPIVKVKLQSRQCRNSVPCIPQAAQVAAARSSSRTKSKIPVKVAEKAPIPALSSRFVLPAGVDDVDGVVDDLFFCPAYSSDVIEYQHQKEAKFALPRSFLAGSEVTPHMRGVLVDWLTQVQVHLDIQTETLHLAVAMADQILARGGIPLGKLQLLGVTSLLIAAKYNERFPPAIEQLIHLTDNTYKFDQVIRMERRVLRALHFQVDVPVSITFLQRYLHVLNTTKGEQIKAEFKLEKLCYYLLDLSLVDVHVSQYHPSLRAAAAVYLSTKLVCEATEQPDITWDRTLTHYTTYSESLLMACVIRMAKLLQKASLSKFKGAWDKYSSRSQSGAICKWEHLSTSNLLVTLAHSKTV